MSDISTNCRYTVHYKIVIACPSRHVTTSLLLAVRVCELVLVVQDQYEQVAVLPRHPLVARVANVYSRQDSANIFVLYTSPTLAVYRVVTPP